jgi:hypothetical protein
MRAALAGALASLASATAPACELPAGATAFASPRFELALATEPARVETGKFFVVRLQVCPKPGASPPEAVTIDAHMPAHRHGMNYAPRLVAERDGAWRADGFLFHMPGAWEFVVELSADGRRERATLPWRIH